MYIFNMYCIYIGVLIGYIYIQKNLQFAAYGQYVLVFISPSVCEPKDTYE